MARRARAGVVVPGPVSAAEALWYDTARWPHFVDGFASVERRDPEWPARGSIVWTSRPEGRGRVEERVVRFSPREGQTAEVEDPRLRGTQRISFALRGEDVRVELELAYELKDAGPLMVVTDLLFIRRAMRDSLRRTLERYARERRGDVERETPRAR